MGTAGRDLRELFATLHLWDNWVVHDAGEGVFHRYLLCAPRSVPPPARHRMARIRHATSSDGLIWIDRGDALAPGPPDGWDGQAVWTGTTVTGAGGLAMLYTGVGPGPAVPQAIGLARSRDGHRFHRLAAPVLAPTAALGYDTGDGDGVVMAWRDPHVFRDPATGAWHMVFACKREGPAPRGAVGHAVARDGDLARWTLMPPLDLPVRYAQIEVPTVLVSGGRYYCFVSTKDADSDDRVEANAALRALSSARVTGPWEPVGAADGAILDASVPVYSVRPFVGPDGPAAVGFFAVGHPRALTPTPVAPLSLAPRVRLDASAWCA